MSTTYAQRQTTAQKKDSSSAASVLDASSQSESLQRKADMANNAAQRAEAPRPNNTGMPDNLKSGIESLSGFSMDDVRVHYNSSKPATVQALAYTQGTDIHVAPGQEKHLPHEAWHVAQQMAGRVSPTTNINGMPVNDNAALEHEANVMGEKAVTQRKENVEIKSKNVPGRALQLKPGEENDMVCAADVRYSDFEGKIKHVKGVGFNDRSDIDDVLATFQKCGLKKLGGREYKVTNPPGQCAEPHAVANALKEIPDSPLSMLFEKDENKRIPDLLSILDIYVSDSVVRRLESESVKSFPKTDGDSVKTYSRCETCAQWIGSDNHVYPNYLEISPTEKNLLEQQRCCSKYEEKKLEKLDSLNERMSFKEKTFHNVRFLNQTHSPLPDCFKNDNEIRNIDEQNGLRTIIKKQLLKNRICEMANKAKSELLTLTENSDFIFADTHILSSKDIKVLPEEKELCEIVEQYRTALKWETENQPRIKLSISLQLKIKNKQVPTEEELGDLLTNLQELLGKKYSYHDFYNSSVKHGFNLNLRKQKLPENLKLPEDPKLLEDLKTPKDWFSWLNDYYKGHLDKVKKIIGETIDEFKEKLADFATAGFKIELGSMKKNIEPEEKIVENSADLAKRIRRTINDESKNVCSSIDKIADAEKAQRYYARLDYYRELIGKQGEITGFDEAETDEAETLF